MDSKTVQALEKKCPRYSQNDQQEIERLIDNGMIFEDVESSWNPELKRRLGQLQVAIPSLDTFFDDWRILKDCSLSLSNLICRKRGQSYTAAFKKSYCGDEAYFQERFSDMWVVALRFYSETQPQPSLPEEELRQKPRPGPPAEVTLHYMAAFAQKHGFMSPKIKSLAKTSQMLEGGADGANPLSIHQSSPSLSQHEKMRYQSGYPDMASFRHDQSYLCWDNFKADSTQGKNMSTFCRLRTLCYAFFRLPQYELPIDTHREETSAWQPREETLGSNNLTAEDSSMTSVDKPYENGQTRKRARDSVLVYFKECKGYRWQEVCRVEEDNPDKVKSVANELSTRYYLLSVACNNSETSVRTILADDCWDMAKDSGIQTVLLSPRGQDELNLDILADLARKLY